MGAHGVVETQFQKLMRGVGDELLQMYERLEELEDAAVDWGLPALEHKLQEARGPLGGAVEAVRQYRNGILEPRNA